MASSVKLKKDGMPVALKIPKSFGACADMLFDLKEARLAAKKVVDAFEEQEKALKEHLINTLPKGDTGAKGTHHQVAIIRDTSYRIEDDQKFYKYVTSKGAFDLLQRSINQKAARDRLDGNKGKPLPGMGEFPIVKVSLTKV